MPQTHKHWFGLPMNLFWGYIAIAIFMSGDGFEMAFLSKHITDMGFTPAQSALVFTVYGLAAALAAWSSGVVAEIITPQKAMRIGFILWLVMHVLFMLFGLGMRNYPLMLLFYGIRGLAYPLFIYSFVMLVVQNVPKQQLSSAMGWFWAMYSNRHRLCRQLSAQLYHSVDGRNRHTVVCDCLGGGRWLDGDVPAAQRG